MIAVDWGTTSLRGARLGHDGAVLEERSFPRGILSVAAGGFDAAFDASFGDWMAHESLCLIAGMAGSRQGWVEAPYCDCPAGPDDVAARLAWVVPGRVAIVPGLTCERNGVPDVMRGEETQVFGALRLLDLEDGTLVLPGTHSKWVRVEGGRVVAFSTWMTGEVYGLLRQHSILGRTLPASDGPFEAAAFDLGVARSVEGIGFLNTAFSVRTLSLFDRMPEHERPSYLSGIVIGEELRVQQLAPDAAVTLIGAPALTLRYERALASLGVRAASLGGEATWRGLHDVARTMTP